MKPNTAARLVAVFLVGILICGLYVTIHVVAQMELNKRLIVAIRQGDVGAVHKALSHGADANTGSSIADLPFRQIIEAVFMRKRVLGGEPALSMALARNYHVHDGKTSSATADLIVHHLLVHGARVEGRSSRGVSPLMDAAYDGCPASINMLVAFGADVNARSDREMTVVMYAVMTRDDRIVRQVLDYGADPNPTMQNRLWPENYIGCNLWTPKEYQARQDRIYHLIIQARRARTQKPPAQ